LVIPGSGHSGTTLLSLLLRQSTDTLNLGQTRDFWRSYARNRTCSCGAKMQDCALWSTAAATAFPGWDKDDFLAMDKRQTAFSKDAEQIQDWGAPDEIAGLTARHETYVADLGRFLRAAREAAGAARVVDISKSPQIALAFHLTGLFEVRLLNLVRDPRAVAVSWDKRVSDRTRLENLMVGWKTRRRRLHRWAEQSAGQDGIAHRVLRYERFVAAPRAETQDLLAWMGDANPAPVFHAPLEALISWDTQHLFPPANDTVLAEKRTEVLVRAPTGWRSLRRHWRVHLLALRATHPDGLPYVLGHDRTPGGKK
jgi:hypothetical protein